MTHLGKSESGVTVILPDWHAQGLSHATAETRQFMPLIEDICISQRYRMMLMVNGKNPDAFVREVETQRERLLKKGFADDHLILPAPQEFKKGTVGAAEMGYEQFLNSDDDIVIKMDTAEHPAQWMPVMVDAIRAEGKHMVFGDLVFNDGKHILGERDRMADREMAKICDEIEIPFHLTNAHGYQAFRKEGFGEVFELAKDIHDRAGRILGATPTWGFDMATILASELLRREQKHLLIPGEKDRIRDNDLDYDSMKLKVDEQAKRWRAVATAYAQLKQERHYI